jgi:hypothetical protein
MEQCRLSSRVQNLILLIRRDLTNNEECECFNDLLIINRIVPKLPSESLMRMLHYLKPYHDLTQTRKSDINIKPLLAILAEAKVKDSLLDDFLASSGYNTTPCSVTA